tara:strand:- start:2454 stop:2666 length:213 start_codon:yes stop_codon:yes gene_type:complete
MSIKELNQLQIGDKVNIVTFHYMEGRLITTRIIRDIRTSIVDGSKQFYVKCFGWERFQLRDGEILNKINN